VKVLAHAEHVHDPGTSEDINDLLTSLDRVRALEHDVDDAQRAFTAEALCAARDFRELHLGTAVGDRLEEAADALQRTSLMLRDHVLEDVLND
jgi:adenylosuccinate lyase